MPSLIDLTGQRFERLLVITRFQSSMGRRVYWRCLCDCGKESVVRGEHLRCGATRSCGCLLSEMAAARAVGLAAQYGPLGRKPDDEITYIAAHGRIVRAKGKASTHPCADCGGQALDWSLRHDASVRQMGVKNGYVCAFSPDPDDYEPRCRKCHVAYDRAS